jgi:hypothetical protein
VALACSLWLVVVVVVVGTDSTGMLYWMWMYGCGTTVIYTTGVVPIFGRSDRCGYLVL